MALALVQRSVHGAHRLCCCLTPEITGCVAVRCSAGLGKKPLTCTPHATTFRPLHKKSAVGIGSPLNRCGESRSQLARGLRLFRSCPFYGGSMGGRKPCRFAPAVPGLPTHRAAAIVWKLWRRLLQTEPTGGQSWHPHTQAQHLTA